MSEFEATGLVYQPPPRTLGVDLGSEARWFVSMRWSVAGEHKIDSISFDHCPNDAEFAQAIADLRERNGRKPP